MFHILSHRPLKEKENKLRKREREREKKKRKRKKEREKKKNRASIENKDDTMFRLNIRHIANINVHLNTTDITTVNDNPPQTVLSTAKQY